MMKIVLLALFFITPGAFADPVCPKPEEIPVGIMCPKEEVKSLTGWIPTSGQTLTKDSYPKLFEFYLNRQNYFCDFELTYCKNLDTRENPKKDPPEAVFWYIRAN